MLLRKAVLASLFVPHIAGKCYTPNPAFPVPSWTEISQELRPALKDLGKKLDQIISAPKYDNVSFAIEVTTTTETVWQHFHTARNVNESRPGTPRVNSSSQYRIASISKAFTVLALLYQHEAGNLRLDDPVSKYIPELAGADAGDLPWDDITIRSLASQLSGLRRDSFQADLINRGNEPWTRGLPPVSRDGLPSCNEYNNYEPCTRSDFIGFMEKSHPMFAPNQISSYSNNAFVLLGLVIQNATGIPYEDYIFKSIFKPLNMTMSTMETPSDEHAVLPADGHSWDVDEAVANPTGGIYSTSGDLSKFLRYILTHFNTLATGVNWLKPASWGFGMNGFYGMPWEIFRTDRILSESGRPVTFVTKSGGLQGYLSHILLVEDYGIGITILVGSSGTDVFMPLLEAMTVDLVRAADVVVWRDVGRKYDGRYVAVDGALNSSMQLTSSSAHGLTVSSFVSNGSSDALAIFAIRDQMLVPPGSFGGFITQLVPTLLFKNETAQKGEIWRAVAVSTEDDTENIWGDYCLTDIDTMSYAGLPVNEIVFWHDEGIVELPAWKVKLKAEKSSMPSGGLIVQG